MLKLDIMKAPMEVLENLGFSPRWRSWIHVHGNHPSVEWDSWFTYCLLVWTKAMEPSILDALYHSDGHATIHVL